MKSLKMTYTDIFKASKFIAVHFLIAFYYGNTNSANVYFGL